MPSIIAKIIGDGKSFDKTVSGVQGKLGTLKKAFGGLATALGGAAVVSFGKRLIETGARISDVSEKLGVSSTFLQEWVFMAERAGVGATAAENALQRFARRTGEAQKGLGVLLPEFKRYNIALFDSEGNARKVEDVMRDYADTVANVTDRQEQLRLSVQAYDIEGGQLVNVIDEGSAGMDRQAAKAHNLSRVIREDSISAMKEFSVAIQDVLAQLTRWGTEGLSQVKKVGTVIGGLLFGEEGDLIEKGFRDAAESAIRFEQEIVTIQKRAGRRPLIGEWVMDGEKFIPIQEAINARVQEMKAAAEATERTLQKQLATAKEKSAEESARATKLDEIKKRETAWEAGLRDIYDEIDEKETARLAKEKERTDELEKQRQTLIDQRMEIEGQLASLQQQSAAFESTGQFGFSFQDILNGTFSGSAQSAAERVLELQARAQQALFFSGADSEAFQRASGFANDAQASFEQRFGVDPVENPFKNALKETEDELREIKEGIEKLQMAFSDQQLEEKPKAKSPPPKASK